MDGEIIKKKVPMHLPEPGSLLNILNKMGIRNNDHVILYPKKLLTYILWLRPQQYILPLNF